MSQENGITYVGLDAHSKEIHVAVILPGSTEVSEQWQVQNTVDSLKRLAKRLLKMAPGKVCAVYEAGPCGYAIQRTLEKFGVGCEICAPALIPVKPGERIKTDKRDARKLARYLRSGDLTMVHPPDEADESLRDLMRARENAKGDLTRARHRLSKMLLRLGLRFDGDNWTQKFMKWLKSLRFELANTQNVFDMYLLAIEQAEERLKILEGHIEEEAASETYAEKVGWLSCLRGVSTITAMTILAELHGFQRFDTPRSLMSYLGLIPSEHSSGERVKRGGITKTGNRHVRRVLVEAAWNYRYRPAVSSVLRKRRKGQPPAVISIADRAQHRLNKRFNTLKEKYRKHHNIAVVAVARELVGFIWAILNHQQLAQTA